jgi:hypothetical protein
MKTDFASYNVAGLVSSILGEIATNAVVRSATRSEYEAIARMSGRAWCERADP